MNRKPNILASFLIVMIALGTLIGCSSDSGKNADKLKKDYSNIEMNPNISVPGYESLELKAGTKKQNVNFYNPGVNTCYFRISLVLKADGTGTDEAESVLWTSDLIEPGEKNKEH